MANLRLLIPLLALCLAACAPVSRSIDEYSTIQSPSITTQAQLSRGAFERFKKLEGEWDTKSTKGWGGRITYKLITGGACVMQTDTVAHDNDTMVTMIHLDNDRLMLTHYCAAKNQPRLVATNITPDLSEIIFEFLDATNIKTRDQGHMDKVVFKFKSDDEFTDQWTWYQDGKETWEEEITNLRVKK